MSGVDLSQLDEAGLVSEASQAVWEDTVYSTADSQQRVDAIYRFLEDSGKPWLYQRGWNRAYKEAGHTLSDQDTLAASPDSYPLQKEKTL